MVPFSFHGEDMWLVTGRALFWPRMETLLVADLHLEKASSYARGGQMLPPYDSRETLARLTDAVHRTRAHRIVALGDSFHDAEGPQRLEPQARAMLEALARTLEWTWIAGNHDADQTGGVGVWREDLRLGGIDLRHHAVRDPQGPEISGHFHPKITLSVRGRRITRPCAVLAQRDGGASRLILPAFGALAGGMRAQDPAIVAAMQPADRIDALVPAAGKLTRFALWRAQSAGNESLVTGM